MLHFETFTAVLAKSNVKYLKKKIEENVEILGKYEKKIEAGDGNFEKEKKKKKTKKSLWSKCFAFVRGQWKLIKSKRVDLDATSRKTENATRSTFGYVRPCMNVIEIPVEPGHNISKILIKPTLTGIQESERLQTMIAHSDGISVLAPKKKGRSVAGVRKSGNEYNWQNFGTKEKRWNRGKELIEKGAANVGKSGSAITSELYPRRDINRVVESALFIEPPCRNPWPESKKSDVLSEKLAFHFSESVRNNEGRVSCRIIDDRNDGIERTFKTLSEPTWKEKGKMFQQRRLQENINNLLEQFMFIERDDAINFTISQSNLNGDKEFVELDGYPASPHPKDLMKLKELSREVSPEVLVNIKPFKEYLSGDFRSLPKSSDEIILRKEIIVDQVKNFKLTECIPEEKSQAVEKQETRSQSSREERKRNEKAEELFENSDCQSSVVRCSNQFLGNDTVEEFRECKLISSAKRLSSSGDKECQGIARDLWDSHPKSRKQAVIAYPPREHPQDSGIRPVGSRLCKSLSNSENSIPSSVDAKEHFSIDEVLENLDDRDHGRIFQRNMTQFRKEISETPIFDFRDPRHLSWPVTTSEANVINLRKEKNKYEIVSCKQVSLVARTPTRKSPSKEWTQELDKFTNAGPIEPNSKNRRNSEMVFENCCLPRSPVNAVRRTLAVRVETLLLRTAEALREMHAILENYLCLVVEKKVPRNSNECRKENRGPDASKSGSGDPQVKFFQVPPSSWNDTNGLLVADLASIQEHDLMEKFCPKAIHSSLVDISRTSNFISTKFLVNPTECFYLYGNFLFTNLEGNGCAIFERNMVFEDYRHKMVLNMKSKESEKDKSEGANKGTGVKWERMLVMSKFFKPVPEAFQTFDNGRCDRSDRGIFPGLFCLDVTTRGSETLARRRNSDESKELGPYSYTGITRVVGNACEPSTRSPEDNSHRRERSFSEKRSGNANSGPFDIFEEDGFRVLYDGQDKESLKDEDEDAGQVEFAKSFTAGGRPSEEKISCAQHSIERVNECREDLHFEGFPASLRRGSGIRNGWDSDKESLEVRFSKSIEKRILTKLLKYKSNSSPRESIVTSECGTQEQRFRRSTNSLKETIKDFLDCKKKRISSLKGQFEVRRTGSTLTEGFQSEFKLERSLGSSMQNKESDPAESKPKKVLVLREILNDTEYEKSKRDPEFYVRQRENDRNWVDVSDYEHLEQSIKRKTILVLEKKGSKEANVRNEILAAFSSIKNIPPRSSDDSGRSKRMSLVIMISKK